MEAKQDIKIPTVNVLDIPIFDGNIPDAFQIVMEQIAQGEKRARHISACDANVFVTSKKDKEFQQILKNAYINLADGMPGVWVGKLRGARRIDRCYGPDFFEYLFRHTADKPVKHYFTGGRPGVAEQLSDECAIRFGNRNVVGTHCPPFRELTEDEIKEVAADINARDVDIVWIGISSPKQDKYARRLAKYARVHFIVTVGAAFDFYTGNVRQAPKYIQRSGFEWLFRLMMEPKRLGKRYLNVVPRFVFYNLMSFLKTT